MIKKSNLITAVSLLALGFALASAPASAAATSGSLGTLADTAPRSVFDDISGSAPKSPFSQIEETAPRSVLDQVQDTAPYGSGSVGSLGDSAP
jgi:hypothetical protein